MKQSARETLLSIAFDCLDSLSVKCRFPLWKSKLTFDSVITKLELVERNLPENDQNSISDWVICPHGFNDENRVGSGSYGDVYRCQWGIQFIVRVLIHVC